MTGVKGTGGRVEYLLRLVRRKLVRSGVVDFIEDAWITPVTGYWAKQDVLRWEGQVKGIKDGREIRIFIASWETVNRCCHKTLTYDVEPLHLFIFYRP